MAIVDIASLVRDRALRAASPLVGIGMPIDMILSIDFSQLVQDLRDFRYDTSNLSPVNLTPTQIDQYDYFNGTDLQQSQTVGRALTTVASVQTTVTHGIQTQSTVKFDLSYSGLGVSADFQQTVSFSVSQQQSTTITQTWNCTTPILIPPQTGIHVDWIVSNAEYSLPFSGNAVLTGNVLVDAHSSGVPCHGIEAIGIGDIFSRFPDPSVQPMSKDAIAVAVAGESTFVQGINLQTVVKQYKADRTTLGEQVHYRYRFHPSVRLDGR